MTDPQAQNPTPDPQAGNAWSNPTDAPPPFPNTASSAFSNPYTSTPNPGWTPAAQQAPASANPDERTWAMLAHLSAPIAAVVSAGWLTIVGPLAVWLLQKDRSAFVRNASAGAFNFTLSMWLTSVIGWVLTVTIIGAVIGIPLIIIGALGSIVLGIVGAVKSWNGESYTYPWQIKILS